MNAVMNMPYKSLCGHFLFFYISRSRIAGLCKVRELEKARFRKRTRAALHRNRSPLMRQEGAAVRLVSATLTQEKSKYI